MSFRQHITVWTLWALLILGTIPGYTAGVTTSGPGVLNASALTGTVAVGNGGTGLSSTTAYAVLCGGATSTGPLQSIASVGTSGQVLTSNGAGNLPTFQSAGGGDYVRIGEVVADGLSGVLTLSSIPATYRSLELIITGRSDAVAANSTLKLTLNNDTGANYQFERIILNNANYAFSGPSLAQAYIDGGSVPANTATANYAASSRVVIPDYAGTAFHKTAIVDAGMFTSAAASDSWKFQNYGHWLSTAVVSRVDVTLAAGNWVTSSKLVVYGMK